RGQRGIDPTPPALFAPDAGSGPRCPPAVSGALPAGENSTVVILAVAELPLCQLAPLLGLDAKRRDRTCLESAQADLVARLFAVAVRAVFDALQRGIDLFQQLAFPVTGAELEAELGLLRRAVVRIREVGRLVLHV